MTTNFTTELFIWIIFCVAGLITSALATRLAHLVLVAVRELSRDADVIDGSAHLRRIQIERVIGWAFLLVIGALALFQPAPENTIGSTPIGLLIRWILIGVIGLWSFETVTDYLFVRKLWRRNNI